MTFDAFYDVIRWLLIPILGAFFFLINRSTKEQREAFDRKHAELVELMKIHRDEDNQIHTRAKQETDALRTQVQAFQLEVTEKYVRNDDLWRIEQGIRHDFDEIKKDVKELLRVVVSSGERRDSRR